MCFGRSLFCVLSVLLEHLLTVCPVERKTYKVGVVKTTIFSPDEPLAADPDFRLSPYRSNWFDEPYLVPALAVSILIERSAQLALVIVVLDIFLANRSELPLLPSRRHNPNRESQPDRLH